MNPSPEDKLAIDILLREYDTLRAEALARIRARFEVVGFIVVSAAFVGSREAVSGSWRLGVGLLALVISGVSWGSFGLALRRLARRLRTIEKKVNKLAGQTLLDWESNPKNRGSWFHSEASE